jgi:hypothetical protein
MGDLKEVLDKEFKEKAANGEPVDSSQRQRFCELLCRAKGFDREDFSAVINYAINYFHMPPKVLGEEPAPASISQWMKNKCAPHPHVRMYVYARRIVGYVGDSRNYA